MDFNKMHGKLAQPFQKFLHGYRSLVNPRIFGFLNKPCLSAFQVLNSQLPPEAC